MEENKKLYVVSDSAGYVGTFLSKNDVASCVVNKYPHVNFLVSEFPFEESGDQHYVWVVLYRDIDHVAFVSNDINKAIKTQSLLNHIELSYTDSIDFWKQNLGSLTELVSERLHYQNEAYVQYIQDIDREQNSKSSLNIINDLINNLNDENKKIKTIESNFTPPEYQYQ
jgi:hypothetical protein